VDRQRLRSVQLGEHMTLQFEDEHTIRRQIQEMLHIEKIFDEDGIQGEIEAYAPLVPDGSNWKATMLIEYPDAHERKRELARLIGVEDRLFVEVEGHARVYAIADEDLNVKTAKASAVHCALNSAPLSAKQSGRRGGQAGLRPHSLPRPCADRRRDLGEPGGRSALSESSWYLGHRRLSNTAGRPAEPGSAGRCCHTPSHGCGSAGAGPEARRR
jgi:hypothetical protein